MNSSFWTGPVAVASNWAANLQAQEPAGSSEAAKVVGPGLARLADLRAAAGAGGRAVELVCARAERHASVLHAVAEAPQLLRLRRARLRRQRRGNNCHRQPQHRRCGSPGRRGHRVILLGSAGLRICSLKFRLAQVVNLGD